MPSHIPVLLHESLTALGVLSGQWYGDATFGGGGHTGAILALGGHVLAFDVDETAIAAGNKRFASEIADGRLILVRQNFEYLEQEVTQRVRAGSCDSLRGILFDFGTSSDQLMDPHRGFSFDGDAPLDMRLDDRLGVTAADLLAILPEKQLCDLFLSEGGEHEARAIAKAVATARQVQPLKTTHQLVTLITKTKHEHRSHLHPATKVFQALRIAVNRERDVIATALPQALHCLSTGGVLVTVSFHEGEDRLVKQAMRGWEAKGKGHALYNGVVTAGAQELEENPRARSAKLRAFKKE